MRIPAFFAAAALVAASGAARADEAADREADMFGTPAATPPPAPAEKPTNDDAQKREDEMFQSSPVQAPQPQPEAKDEKQPELTPVDTTALYKKADETYDKLAIGGRLFNQDQISFHEDDAFRTATLSLPTLLDVYLDGRPNDQLRAYARGRVSFDPSVREGTATLFGTTTVSQQQLTTSLDQLWLKWDVYHKVFFTLGRQRIKWGSGRFWNPTDFLNAQRLNALALVDTRLGTTLFKIHYPVESLGWNFYGIVNLTNAARPDDAGFALRGEFLLGPAELSLSSQVRRAATPGTFPPTLVQAAAGSIPGASVENFQRNADATPDRDLKTQVQIGADISTGIGPFDVHAEAALTHGNKALFLYEPFVNALGTAFLTPNGNAPIPTDAMRYRDDEWIQQYVVGADVSVKYSEEDSVNLGVEYFYNGAGTDSAKVYPFLFASGSGTFFYLGQHYLAASASFINPGSWNNTSFVLSNLSNLTDGSNLARLDYSLVALTNMTFRAFVNYHYGASGEFKSSTAVFGLPTGTPAAASPSSGPILVDAGVGFILNL